MKNCKKLLLLFVLLGVTVMLSGCSNFSSVKKAMTNDGWEYVEKEDANSQKITAELSEGNISVTVHTFKKGILGFAVVLEFGSTKDLEKAFSEEGSATLKGLITDFQKSEYVNGNCVLITLSPDALSSFKKA